MPDLTHAHTVRLLYSYHETDTYLDTSRVDLLRQIRIFRDSDDVVLYKPGKSESMGFAHKGEEGAVGEDWTDGAAAAAEAEKEEQVAMVTDE